MQSTVDSKIPKIIHYCWFGKGKKSKFIKKCIKSWEKVLPDYQIIEWNEENFPTDYNRYVSQAYESKKYAFVSDVARLYALYEMGGVYFDTDIEVRKPLDSYLNAASMIMAFESNQVIMTGFFAATKHNKFIGEWLKTYEKIKYIKEDGTIDVTPNTFRVSKMLADKGLVMNGKMQNIDDGITVYEKEVFGAYDVDNSGYVTTPETVIIHHCKNSWMPLSYKIKDLIKRTLALLLGIQRYKRLKNLLKGKRT